LTAAVGGRRTFTLRGFSICPPAGAQEAPKGDSTDLAAYNVVDSNSGAVLMTVRIGHNIQEAPENSSLTEYAGKLAAQLALDQDFHSEAATAATASEPVSAPPAAFTTTAAGKGAIELRGGVGRGNLQRFRRDYWVLMETSPKQFLSLQFTGPAAQREGILRSSQSVMATLQLFDPVPLRKSLEAARVNAEKLLAGLTRDKVLSVLAKSDYWLAAMRGEQLAGFVHLTESVGYEGQIEGVKVVVQSALIADDGSRLLSRQDLFSSTDRVLERWEQRSVTLGRDGNEVGRSRRFGMRQHDQLEVQTVTGPHDTLSLSKQIPEAICLPLAFSPLLPRLIDRTPGAMYALAQYDPASEDVAMRVVRVVGPGSLTLGGQTFAVTEIDDRPDVDGPLTKLYVDASALPLKCVITDATGRQTLMQRTTAAFIAQHFPTELKRFETP
jgi:hypothetical protein